MRKEFERHLKTYKVHYLNTESTLRTQQHKNLIKRKVFHQNEDIQMTDKYMKRCLTWQVTCSWQMKTSGNKKNSC